MQVCYAFRSKTGSKWLLLHQSKGLPPFLTENLTSLLHGINIRASLPEKCKLSVHVQHEGTLDFARNAKHHL